MNYVMTNSPQATADLCGGNESSLRICNKHMAIAFQSQTKYIENPMQRHVLAQPPFIVPWKRHGVIVSGGKAGWLQQFLKLWDDPPSWEGLKVSYQGMCESWQYFPRHQFSHAPFFSDC